MKLVKAHRCLACRKASVAHLCDACIDELPDQMLWAVAQLGATAVLQCAVWLKSLREEQRVMRRHR